MNRYRILLCVAFATILSAPASASNVTLPNTFTAGTPAKAAEVNANFSAVKSAVDDNNSRLTTIESTASDHDTRLTDLETQVREAGAVSVSAHGFDYLARDLACLFRRISAGGQFAYFDNPGGFNCYLTTSVALPHGAAITGVSCLVFDNDALGQLNYHLGRVDLSGVGIVSNVYVSGGTTDQSFPVNLSAGAVGGNTTVDNTTYAYYLRIDFSAGVLSSTTNLGFFGCRINYSL